MRRRDGSTYDENQLRHNGRFIRERIRLTALDKHILSGSGYTLDEMRQAERELNIRLDEKIKAGANERELMQTMYAAV